VTRAEFACNDKLHDMIGQKKMLGHMVTREIRNLFLRNECNSEVLACQDCVDQS
jgi:hypothetical protein